MTATAPILAAECIPRNRSAQQFVSSFLRGISPLDCFDARAVLDEHPEVAATKAAVLDLALEDYCRREAAGEKIAPTAFAQQFSPHAASVLHLLQFRQFLEANGAELAAAAPEWPLVGDEFLGFLLLEELGRGAAARVYLAMQPAIADRLVVLKVTPNSISEVNTLGRLSHPHVAAIHSVQADDARGLAGICMPYFGRATLNDVLAVVQAEGVPALCGSLVKNVNALNDIPVPGAARSNLGAKRYVDLVIEIGRQIASALEYTHGEGISHFDIKPTNVLISSDLTIRLIDFNLAATTAQQSLGGTVPYMSPEQLRRHLNRPLEHREGPASDVFSLGVLLFELLTGRHPFRQFEQGEDRWQAAEELLAAQQAGMQSLRTLNPLVDRRLESILSACLDPVPARRPDAASLRSQLERELSVWASLSRWTLSHRRSLRWSTAAAGVLVTAMASSLVLRDPPAVRAFDQAVKLEQQGDVAHAESAYDAGIKADPTQSRLWFGRGKCRLAQNRFEDAYHDFLQARATGEGPLASAYAGYCLCLMQRDWKEPIALFQEAESLGLERQGLWNDLAYCFYRTGDLVLAKDYLERCFATGPTCGESHYIFARLKMVESTKARDGKQNLQSIQSLHEARNALDEALLLGYETADVHFDEACINAMIAARSAISSDGTIDRIQASLTAAIGLGLNPNRIQELEMFWPELKGRLNRPVVPSQKLPSRPPIVDPCGINPSTVASVNH